VGRGGRSGAVGGAAAPTPHKLTNFARVEGTRITSPGEAKAAADAAQAGLFDAPQ
jgi:hypothetical protein